jgi:serine phosphatase RsbU (regulator of sigma subunit)
MKPGRNTLKYAGANNPIIIANNEKILELKPDKMPISLYMDIKKSFFTQEIEITSNDMIYMYTDGFVDQFGGEKGKKFFKRNLFKLVKSISSKNIIEQKTILNDTFNSWKADEPQLDDVTLLGFRIPN